MIIPVEGYSQRQSMSSQSGICLLSGSAFTWRHKNVTKSLVGCLKICRTRVSLWKKDNLCKDTAPHIGVNMKILTT